MTLKKLNIVILISGDGSNLQAIINAIDQQQLPATIKAVISSNPDAYGLQRATQAKIQTHTIAKKNFAQREDYDEALSTCAAKYSPDLIVLAGFMHILRDQFLKEHENKIINIHPSLLPQYPGLNTHELAIAHGSLEHGCSIHFVNAQVDAGPLIAQATIKVMHDDTVTSLKQRVHKAEHFLYPTVLNWFAKGRVALIDDTVLIDKVPLPKSGMRFELNIL